jgi:hypothetical protein
VQEHHVTRCDEHGRKLLHLSEFGMLQHSCLRWLHIMHIRSVWPGKGSCVQEYSEDACRGGDLELARTAEALRNGLMCSPCDVVHRPASMLGAMRVHACCNEPHLCPRLLNIVQANTKGLTGTKSLNWCGNIQTMHASGEILKSPEQPRRYTTGSCVHLAMLYTGLPPCWVPSGGCKLASLPGRRTWCWKGPARTCKEHKSSSWN